MGGSLALGRPSPRADHGPAGPERRVRDGDPQQRRDGHRATALMSRGFGPGGAPYFLDKFLQKKGRMLIALLSVFFLKLLFLNHFQ